VVVGNHKIRNLGLRKSGI